MIYFRKNWNGITELFTHVTDDDTQPLFDKVLTEDPLPVVKILAKSKKAIELFCREPRYKKIVLLPRSLKRIILKNEIAIQACDWAGPEEARLQRREHMCGKVVIDKYKIEHYVKQLNYISAIANRADYVFYDQDIIADPNGNFLTPLKLPTLTGGELEGHFHPHTLDDRAMLEDTFVFDTVCERLGIT
jgi:hypothetical protein